MHKGTMFCVFLALQFPEVWLLEDNSVTLEKIVLSDQWFLLLASNYNKIQDK